MIVTSALLKRIGQMPKKYGFSYPNLQSAMQPVPHSDHIPVPVYKDFLSVDNLIGMPDECDEFHDVMDSYFEVTSSMPKSLSGQNVLINENRNDLVRDLCLSKIERKEPLGARDKYNILS